MAVEDAPSETTIWARTGRNRDVQSREILKPTAKPYCKAALAMGITYR